MEVAVRTVLGLAPWAVVLAVAGVAVVFLYEQHLVVGRLLLAAILAAHGLVHLLYLAPAPEPRTGGPEWPFDLRNPWPATAGVDPALVRRAGLALLAGTVIAFQLAALATVGLVVPGAAWPVMVAIGSLLSLVLLVISFSANLVLGIGIDLVLLWVALGTDWLPGAA